MVASHFQVNILKRVIEEVEKVMQEFKTTLYKSMEDPQVDLTSVSSALNAFSSSVTVLIMINRC